MLALILSVNTVKAYQKYEITDNNTVRRIFDKDSVDVTEYLNKTGLFKFESGRITNNLNDWSFFKISDGVTKEFINNGQIGRLNNFSTASIENRGFTDVLVSEKGGIENTGYIQSISKAEKVVNKGYINKLTAKNVSNEGYFTTGSPFESVENYGIARINSSSLSNVKNYGIIHSEKKRSDIPGENYGIASSGHPPALYDTDYHLVFHTVSFPGELSADDKGRIIRNYTRGSNTSTLLSDIDNSIVNMNMATIAGEFTVKNNSILNLFFTAMEDNLKLTVDNSTLNIVQHNLGYGSKEADGVEIELRNNSMVGQLELYSSPKILTMDNTTTVGSISTKAEVINLVSNPDHKDKVLILSHVFRNETWAFDPVTNISTNVKLLGGHIELGNIKVKDGGVLTIGSNALQNNGYRNRIWYSYPKKYDISVEGSGKILIAVDPYNIENIIELGEGNNLTGSVKGQNDPLMTNEVLPQGKLNIDADSLLHDIVILPAEPVIYYYIDRSISWGPRDRLAPILVRNKLKAIEVTDLPVPLPQTEQSGSATLPTLKFKVADNSTIKRETRAGTDNVTEYLKNTGLFKFESDSIVNNLKNGSNFEIYGGVTKKFINEGKIKNLESASASAVINRGYIDEIRLMRANEVKNTGFIYSLSGVNGKVTNKGQVDILNVKNLHNEGKVSRLQYNENVKNYGYITVNEKYYIENIKDKEDFKNYGILNIYPSTDQPSELVYIDNLAKKKIDNKGIVNTDWTNFIAESMDDKGRIIKNYKNGSDSGTLDTNISNKIINIYGMTVNKDLNLTNNSILNMSFLEIGIPNSKLNFNNSTINGKLAVNEGTEISLINNSTIGELTVASSINPNEKIKNLTMDNTTNVGELNLYVDEINLIPNPNEKDRVLNLSRIIYNNYDNELQTNVSTNVNLLGNTMLGNITVKDGGVLTIGKDALSKNGSLYGSFKNDISIEGNGKILIAVDPYDTETIIELGKGNNLTESVTGQKDPAEKSGLSAVRPLSQAAPNIDADSLLHDIVILPAESVTYSNGTFMVRNKLKVLETPSLPITPGTPSTPGTPGTPGSPVTPEDYDYLNAIYRSLRTAGWVKDFRVYDSRQLDGLYRYIRDIYSNNPYSVSHNTSFGNLSTFRNNIISNNKNPEAGKWIVEGGINYDTGKAHYNLATTDIKTDTSGLFAKGEYGFTDTLSGGIILGGANSTSKMDTGKVKGNSIYVGAYGKKEINNFRIMAGVGAETGSYRTERIAIGYEDIVDSYVHNGKHRNTGFDVFTDVRYSQPIGKDFYIEPSINLAYSTVKQGAISENDDHIALEIDSKRFNRTASKVGVDIRKEVPMGVLTHTFKAGVSYEMLLSGSKADSLTGRVRNGTDFEILVPKKEKGRAGIGAEYRLETGKGLSINAKIDYGFGQGSNKKDMKFKTGLSYEF